MSDDPYHKALTRTLKAEDAQPSELERLHQDYPGLSVTTQWSSPNSGPGVTIYAGIWRGHVVGGLDVQELREKLYKLAGDPGGPEGPSATG